MTLKVKLILPLLTTVTLCVMSKTADAGFIVSPIGTSTSFTSANLEPISNLTDQSGLDSGFASGTENFDFAVANNTHDVSQGAWRSPTQTSGTIDFDLGSELTVERLALWNGDSNPNWNINAFEVLTDVNADFSTAVNVGAFANPLNPRSAGRYTATVFDLVDSDARYVRIQVNSNHGQVGTVVGEVGFDASAIPEPSSLLLTAIGCGAFAFRRGRRSSAAKKAE